MEQQTFFSQEASAPLAARLRPQTLDEIAGQRHLLGEGKILRRLIRERPCFLHDLLGASRRGQDDACPRDREPHQSSVH